MTFCAQVLQALDADQGNQTNAADKLQNVFLKNDWKFYRSTRKQDSIRRMNSIFKQANMFCVT